MKNKTIEYNYLKTALPAYLILFFILTTAFLAPYLESRMIPESRFFYASLSHVCHQAPTRCFWVFGSNMALCTRCFGIFSALFLTGLVMGWSGIKKIRWKTPLLLILPAVIDGAAGIFGWWKSTNVLRFLTGIMAGTGAAIALFPIYYAFFSGLLLMFRKNKTSLE